MEGSTANICVECGICCDGTMFSRLPPASENAAEAMAAGPTTAAAEAGPAQPCPAHHLACTVYRERPGACRHYQCALLKQHLAGLTSWEEAAEIVSRARALRDRARASIEAVLGAHAGLGLNDLAGQFSALVHGERLPLSNPAHMRAHESLSALDSILSQHFHAAGAEGGPTSP